MEDRPVEHSPRGDREILPDLLDLDRRTPHRPGQARADLLPVLAGTVAVFLPF